MTQTESTHASTVPASLEQRIAEVGTALRDRLLAVLEQLPAARPQQLATHLSLDKVLTSRVIKATRARDPIAVAYHIPGPEPLRRFLKAARRVGVDITLVKAADAAVANFVNLVRRDVGDRSALDALLSAWLPDARAEFELRRKQTAFRALSQLRGTVASERIATALLHPHADGEHLDIVWIFGLLGVRRLRPGVQTTLTTRRYSDGSQRPRQPTAFDGTALDDLTDLRLDAFCHSPPAAVDVHRSGESIRYSLAGDDYGPDSVVDLLMAEANIGEMKRFVPAGSGRKGFMYVNVSTPVRTLLFDVLVHPGVYPGADPSLLFYDTTSEGTADVNDRERDLDRLEYSETIQHLGRGTAKFRVADVPDYVEMLRHVANRMGWNAEEFRGYRCRIDYPVYGTQVVMAFDPPTTPGVRRQSLSSTFVHPSPASDVRVRTKVEESD
jgi:hypothetical protein